MTMLTRRAAITAVIAVMGFTATAEAQVRRANGYRAARPVYYAAPKKMVIEGDKKPNGEAGKAQAASRGYPRLNAPLYTSPVQHVPYQMGSTFITNQAFAPHEMLHPHTYKALYGPFYYRVRGSWVVLPCGVESYDHWKLMGTEVKVEYRSHIPLFSRFTKPWFN